MKRSIAAVAMAMVAALAACDSDIDAAPPSTESRLDRGEAAAPAPAAEMVSADPVMPGAPAYAALYPGATLDAEPTVAEGPAGPGGLVTFTTQADPDAVVAFYRERAEAAGLTSVTAMNQGGTQAYGAAAPEGGDLQVVASRREDDVTAVQLTWSADQ